MNRVDELIKQYAADGVEYKALRDIGTWIGGITPSKAVANYWEGGTIPWVTSMDISATNGSKIRGRITQSALDETSLRLVPGPSVAVVMRSNVLRRFLPIGFITIDATVNQDLRLLTPHEGIDARYVYWALQAASERIRQSCVRTDGSMAAVNSQAFFKWRIPVPPIAVQQELVKIFDAFSDLEAAIEDELVLRREQRVAVIGNELVARGTTERVALGDIATQVVDPIKVEPDAQYVNLGVKWYGEGAFAREPKPGREIKAKTLYKVRAGQFIYNRMFVTEGSFGLVTPEIEHGVVSNEFPVFELDESRILPEWLYLQFRDPYIVSVVAAQASGGTKSRRRWKEEQFNAFVIDLPSLVVQRDMVEIHNSFVDLSAAIEEELTLRRQQFAHYRDKLLTFEESAA